MRRTRTLLAAGVLLVVMDGSAVLALDPLGPPRTGPAKGQFQLGADALYGWLDIENRQKYSNRTFDNGAYNPDMSISGRTSAKYTNQATSNLYANLGYGILQNWEAFLRLGGADPGPWSDTRVTDGCGCVVWRLCRDAHCDS